MYSEHSILAALLAGLVLCYLLRSSWTSSSSSSHRVQSRRYRPTHRDCFEEGYTGTGDGGVTPASGDTTPTVPVGAEATQNLLDFSDVMVTEEQRRETDAVQSDTKQLQTINERFDAARRSTHENRMRTGVYTNKERRKLVEKLLRRPHCGRRVRSWRTENSDILRGDVRPLITGDTSNVLRSAKSNPEVDLHPGALGPMAGKAGLWLSDANVPANLMDDADYVEA